MDSLKEVSNAIYDIKEKLTDEEFKFIQDKLQIIHNNPDAGTFYKVKYIEISYTLTCAKLSDSDSDFEEDEDASRIRINSNFSTTKKTVILQYDESFSHGNFHKCLFQSSIYKNVIDDFEEEGVYYDFDATKYYFPKDDNVDIIYKYIIFDIQKLE